jgi:antitoxin (DNA-binding transcriptional repressor) of toxin-antitoxin stability system
MSQATISELQTNAQSIMKRVSEGEVFIIEQDGEAIAQIQPIPKSIPQSIQESRPARPMPDREALIQSLPLCMDSGRILEEDRS